MSGSVVRFEGVSKKYFLGRERSNLRAAIPGRFGERTTRSTFLALDDVSFEASQGEALGIIGPNGAGKSTALKIVAGIVRPTSGRVTRPKRVVSVIELGLGFNPDLNAVENIEYGGAMLGMSVAECRRKRSDIIDFAELGPFVDMPVKRYSSGMLARLGFSLATSVETDLFVVDEVLSVGDWGFQRRSLERMREINAGGTTILFVSHNLWVVGQLCKNAVLLENGALKEVGEVNRVIGRYVGATPYLNSLTEEGDTASTLSEPPIESREGVGGDTSTAAHMVELTTSSEDERVGVGDGGSESSVSSFDAAYAGSFSEVPEWAVGAPFVFDSVEMVPKSIRSGEAVSLVGELEVRRPIPGARIVIGAYWEGFAGFSAPDELPSSCLNELGRHRFVVRFPSLPSSPAVVTFQIAIVSAEEPEDPEQLLPNAITTARADVEVIGPVTSRPGVFLPREWSVEPVEPSTPQRFP